MKHLLYKIVNKVNHRFYIGMHSTKNVNDGYFGSGRRIKAEINKYGKENFEKVIIEELPSRKALENREREIVNESMLADPLCLNFKNGGEGGGKFWSEEHQKKAQSSGGKSWHEKYGKEWRLRGSVAGGKISGKINQEKTQTPEANVKRIETLKRIGHQKGEKNSQYGTCWVVKDTKPIKIKKEQLHEYLLLGYHRGRMCG